MTDLWYIEQKREKKSLKNGFYLIQALIYDRMRINLYLLSKKLEKQAIEVVAVKTDCLYTAKMPDTSKLSFTTGKNWEI